MGKVHDEIPVDLQSWLLKQPMFFVSTAPLSAEGHINCSPKGLDSFRVASANKVAYLDLTGSGAETIAHLRENGRIVLMFCEFTGPPNIVRLYGTGTVHQAGTIGFEKWASDFTDAPAARAVIEINVTRVSESCGYGVPKLAFSNHRDTLEKWGSKKTTEELAEYQKNKNSTSIDGLPAMKF